MATISKIERIAKDMAGKWQALVSFSDGSAQFFKFQSLPNDKEINAVAEKYLIPDPPESMDERIAKVDPEVKAEIEARALAEGK